jgi:BirA family biotin operon repressor/biotin-[acetyl-CoA-carboxylase] ligase
MKDPRGPADSAVASGLDANAHAAGGFDLPRLRALLKPFRLHWSPTLRSTNDHAAELRRRGELYAPAVVLSGRQTAGRGRGAHVWWSGPGCITVTFVLPVGEQVQPHQLPLIAGVAVRSAAAELTGNDGIQLKWPNDLLYDGRKLAGLLCERVEKADLVGLGLNVNLEPASAPKPLRDRVTSLSQIANRALDMTDVLSTVAAHLHRSIQRQADQPFALLLREYDAHHTLVGRTVSVLDGADAVAISGRCEGLDDMGRLLLRSRSQVHHVISGQVQAM